MSSLSSIVAISLSSLISSASSPIFVNKFVNYGIDCDLCIANRQLHSNNGNSISLNQPKYAIELRLKSDDEWMIVVNRQPTFWLKDLPKAAIVTAKLALIMNSPEFDPNRFEPLVINGEYIGKYKNDILFKLPKSEVVNPSLNLTQWINNLRVSAGAEPLTLVEAQKQMFQLASTNEQIDGIASWYGPYFQGRQTASGEQFEQQDFTAAHPSLPFDTYLKVTNQNNGRSVVVRINDRGPYVGDRNLDLSHAAAIALNSDEVGVVPITATVLVPPKNN
ncbi:septal ring lytic transglycosylase RlpA family protein [Pseudanabaena sp. 'Roaring Creek']|uniref:septal ring lytic transglycosylase RlpA family protein n=1 Tax=Pseudanabaena sp. 'Roaring Creek' TaxID=1681830 RepID=UPI0006D82336|nr:septal ring lytic transglycosylase RlpA family protein [Pseudanabaena sp. 'Roaring Creek']